MTSAPVSDTGDIVQSAGGCSLRCRRLSLSVAVMCGAESLVVLVVLSVSTGSAHVPLEDIFAVFSGGMLAAAIVLFLLRRMADCGAERLILAGLAVSFLFTAIINYLVFAGDQRTAHSVLFWSPGGLGLARWQTIPLRLLVLWLSAILMLCLPGTLLPERF